jgi:hypothetical protein
MAVEKKYFDLENGDEPILTQEKRIRKMALDRFE